MYCEFQRMEGYMRKPRTLPRLCADCDREMSLKEMHKRCPTCRKKVLCECGKIKCRDSKTCKACMKLGGPGYGRWNGGKTHHKKGYVMMYHPTHPRGRYVFEHILVMEEHLGRLLEMDETVHHINGVKHDNQLENLELWVKPQPTGIRVEDAVAWAHKILSRYADIGGPDEESHLVSKKLQKGDLHKLVPCLVTSVE